MAGTSKSIELDPIDLSNCGQFEEFRQQRKSCGWDFEEHHLQRWRQAINDGSITLFWIVQPLSKEHVGHVGLRRGPPDMNREIFLPPGLESDGDPKALFMTISILFVERKFQNAGIGGLVIGKLESMVTQPPHGDVRCKAVSINCLDRRYMYDKSPEWQELYTRTPHRPPPMSNEDWYRRRGYEYWRVGFPYYTDFTDGTEGKLELKSVDLWKKVA